MTATPSAPPTWRVVSLMAEPTPARPAGTAPMIDAVAGAMVRPMPKANTHWVTRMAGIAAVDGEARPAPAMETATTAEPGGDDGPGPRPPNQPGCGVGHHQQDDGEGDAAQAGAERVVAEHELQVLGLEEDDAEEAEVQRGDGQAGRGEPRVGEQPQVEHRRPAAQLDLDEQREHGQRHGEGAEHDRAGPAPARSLDDGVHQRRQPDDRQQRAGRVEAGPRQRPVEVGTSSAPATRATSAHGHVHPEHRTPVEVAQQQPAGHRAEPDADAGGAGPHGDGPLALHRVGEDVGEDGQRRREDQRGPDSGEGPQGDQLRRARRQRRRARREGEQRQPGAQRTPPPEPVAEAPGRQQQSGEHDGVGVDDPLQAARAGVQIPHQARAGRR